jgi:hypothetical protein
LRYLPFDEAKKFVHSLEIKSQKEWDIFCKDGKRPGNIPVLPERVYKKDWKVGVIG